LELIVSFTGVKSENGKQLYSYFISLIRFLNREIFLQLNAYHITATTLQHPPTRYLTTVLTTWSTVYKYVQPSLQKFWLGEKIRCVHCLQHPIVLRAKGLLFPAFIFENSSRSGNKKKLLLIIMSMFVFHSFSFVPHKRLCTRQTSDNWKGCNQHESTILRVSF
jgi:hypothetical protein